jgi:antitoxin component HigA of HigAB toxin-antitoxin module
MPAKKFNTTNPESLIYQNEMLKLTVLGGIKLDGLDRMRSTLKIELKQSSVPPVRHNLDLYNDNQTEKLIRKTAEKLEIGTSVIAASLVELTEQLETYRIEQIKKSQPQPYESPKLSTEERKEAERFLSSAGLLERTNEMIGKSGMIGEENNRLLMYLIFTSRKQAQPLHIVSLGASGTGKTHLQEKVGELIPEEDKIEITTLSENAFYYFGQRELKNKLILIEDLDGAENVMYPLRELQSKKRISKTVAHKNTKGETKTMHLVVEGPVSVAGCTTKEYIYEDNANRSFLIYLDETEEQDQRIMQYQRTASAGKINKHEEEQAANLLQNCQRLLEPIKIVNPFAELLQIPKEVFKPRRTNNHYLQFIEVVTFYHQHQRTQKVDEETGELFIETTLEDVEATNQLLKESLLRKSDELNGACRNYLEQIKAYLEVENKKSFSNLEIRKKLRINQSNQKRWTINLVSNYFLKRVKGNKNQGYQYQITSYEEYRQLKEKINCALDESLEALKNLLHEKNERSKAVQTENEPSKSKRIRSVKV